MENRWARRITLFGILLSVIFIIGIVPGLGQESAVNQPAEVDSDQLNEKPPLGETKTPKEIGIQHGDDLRIQQQRDVDQLRQQETVTVTVTRTVLVERTVTVVREVTRTVVIEYTVTVIEEETVTVPIERTVTVIEEETVTVPIERTVRVTQASTGGGGSGGLFLGFGSGAILVGGIAMVALRRRSGQESTDSVEDDREGGSETSSPYQDSSTTGGETTTSPQSATESTADGDIFATVDNLLNEGDDRRRDANNYRDSGEYNRALAAYDTALDTYEDALETASESDLIDTGEIEQRLATVEKEQQETHHQQLRDEVESLRSDLHHVDELIDKRDFTDAQERLTDLESHLRSTKESAARQDFDDLQDEITTLEQRREELLAIITEQLESDPIPDEIPRTPDVSVDYDALTDKEPIGGGGNADVTKATLSTPDGDVTLAIKEPRLTGTLHSDQVERMLEEAETWDKLDDHDHIVGVVDYGSEPIPWIAMEYMDGGHLGDRSGGMDIPQALWTAIAVTKGVRHAHRRGVAHLDLKPANILFRTIEDAWDVPKVADWGLSKHLLDHSKSIEGYTPTYSAPEQLDSKYGTADDITDVYQLGAVFYEFFTGSPPFDGENTGQIVRQVLDEEPTPPSEIADVPQELDEILLTALAKEKHERYESVLLLRNALQDVYDQW